MEVNYLSPEKHEELKQELNNLKTDGRQAVARRLKHAKELGDLSENSEYQEARAEQSLLEKRINELEEILRNATIIKKSANNTNVRIGSQVKLKKNNDTVTYTIVGSNEARPSGGMISNESPVGRAVLGKRVGDSVIVETIGGTTVYKILEIE